MPEFKWKSHRSENFFRKRSEQNSINYGLVGPLGNRDNAANHYHKTELKWKGELKFIKNKNKMLFGMENESISRRNIKKIKNIKVKASKKCSYSSIVMSGS